MFTRARMNMCASLLQKEWETDSMGLPAMPAPVFYGAAFEMIGTKLVVLERSAGATSTTPFLPPLLAFARH